MRALALGAVDATPTITMFVIGYKNSALTNIFPPLSHLLFIVSGAKRRRVRTTKSESMPILPLFVPY